MRTLHVGNSWVTAARMLPTTKKLVVSSFSRYMKIYDMHTYELCGQVRATGTALQCTLQTGWPHLIVTGYVGIPLRTRLHAWRSPA
jgi:hypothetical protein